MTNDEEIAEYCDSCKHLVFEAETNATFCGLDKEPCPQMESPDEPKFLYCESKKEEEI